MRGKVIEGRLRHPDLGNAKSVRVAREVERNTGRELAQVVQPELAVQVLARAAEGAPRASPVALPFDDCAGRDTREARQVAHALEPRRIELERYPAFDDARFLSLRKRCRAVRVDLPLLTPLQHDQ